MKKVWFTALCALALATASALASPALAGAGRATAQVSPRGFGTPAQIPWGSVGTGWALTDWTAGPPGQHLAPSYLVLTNQLGQRYIVIKKSGPLASAGLLDWSGDGQRALLDTESQMGKTTLFVADLHTGAVVDRFVLPTSGTDDFQSAAFTRPDGLAVVASTYTNHLVLTRYSLAGRPEVTYPSSVASVGKLAGWIYKPDGTEIAFGGQHGLAVVANDGTSVRALRLGDSRLSCTPMSWWSANEVLATCLVGPRLEARLFEFPVTGGTPRALTRSNVGSDDGDIGAWRVGGHVYVEVASACGYRYLAKLVGAAPIMIHLPGVAAGKSVQVVGAGTTALAISTNIACHGGPSLLWYTPSSNSIRVVLGQPVTGGQMGVSVAYPPRLG